MSEWWGWSWLMASYDGGTQSIVPMGENVRYNDELGPLLSWIDGRPTAWSWSDDSTDPDVYPYPPPHDITWGHEWFWTMLYHHEWLDERGETLEFYL